MRPCKFLRSNVSPVPVAYIPVSSRKIIPLHQFASDRNVEHAITLVRQFLCRSQDLPCPGIDRHFALKCFAIDARNVARRIVKTHLSVHLATASKASSITRCNFVSSLPWAVISTNVPRSGRARRTSLETDFICGQDPAHPIGDVSTGESRATDVGDAVVQGRSVSPVLPTNCLRQSGF